eukprot:TRINITY_DN1135_c0_g1_i3.p1 TRINITY_DN1135_c0_g1~~TRINITY_DN1135_c0_g1_i3.p1  ORF type:complete len:136 (+),score=25.68 TRINITY_DN1135_c0_g1_i3:40-447(+)
MGIPNLTQQEQTELATASQSLRLPVEINKNLLYGLFLDIKKGESAQFCSKFESLNLSPDTELNAFGWTGLHTAAYVGNTEVVKYLLAKGANLNILNSSGLTPVKLADHARQSEILRLIKGEADFGLKEEGKLIAA